MKQKHNIGATILEIEAKASTCDYIERCALIKRMKTLEETDIAWNIDKLVGIYGHIYKHCNDKKYPECRHFKYEMLKSQDIMD